MLGMCQALRTGASGFVSGSTPGCSFAFASHHLSAAKICHAGEGTAEEPVAELAPADDAAPASLLARTRLNRGRALALAGDHESAAAAYERLEAAGQLHGQPAAWLCYAHALAGSGAPLRAEGAAQRAIEDASQAEVGPFAPFELRHALQVTPRACCSAAPAVEARTKDHGGPKAKAGLTRPALQGSVIDCVCGTCMLVCWRGTCSQSSASIVQVLLGALHVLCQVRVQQGDAAGVLQLLHHIQDLKPGEVSRHPILLS